MLMLNVTVECRRRMSMLNATTNELRASGHGLYMPVQKLFWAAWQLHVAAHGLHIAAYGVPRETLRLHMAA